ncbi:flavin reductase family protein [Nocardia cyriacigeorgica]|uniref:Flavin reductase family protein n=1 Tax=Nocardia cyriacigeorgica TaxID=135487 RepID=A0A5R8PDT8_9NOCA|nr:flavin reductase family protein [Nocardia cyriacigeorgica]TLG10839.1 flavin reductase family protein [Nocardia cyriacigeorgica]
MSHPVDLAHRLLAPRIAYLIGTKDPAGTANLIPVSNLTSVSTRPQQIALAVLKQWQTHRNLLTASGFTVSVPTIEQLDGAWKLGAKYSRFPVADPSQKLAECGLALNDDLSTYGPVVPSSIGWLSCRIIARLDLSGDHGITIGEVEQVWFNPDQLTSEGKPRTTTHPLMQQTGNLFTTTRDAQSVRYF